MNPSVDERVEENDLQSINQAEKDLAIFAAIIGRRPGLARSAHPGETAFAMPTINEPRKPAAQRVDFAPAAEDIESQPNPHPVGSPDYWKLELAREAAREQKANRRRETLRTWVRRLSFDAARRLSEARARIKVPA